MVELSAAEKKAMCEELTRHLPKIRKLLSLTQADLGNLLGSLLGGTSQKQTTTAQADGTELLGLLTGLLK